MPLVHYYLGRPAHFWVAVMSRRDPAPATAAPTSTAVVPVRDRDAGAHGAQPGYRLLTRDVRRYRSYFPTIEIIAPTPAEDETTR
jgi:hypothetical protein